VVHHALRRAVREVTGEPRGPVAAIVCTRLNESWPDLPARTRVAYATDDVVAGADLFGVPAARLAKLERAALRGADMVAVVSPVLRDRYAAEGFDATLVPNGCDPQAYAAVDREPGAADVKLTGPVAGFVGHVNDRIDLTLLEAVADQGISLLVVGPLDRRSHAERFEALCSRPNVQWVGPRPFEELPGYLRFIDVGLTPYVDSAFNRASFPLKTLEYLAAGRAAVATDLPAHRWLNTDLVRIATGAADFVAAVADALATPRTNEIVATRRSFAQRHTWRARAAAMAELIEGTGR
jgi:teichuronic acid biosynthesis glycosyltransferase TuaH